jgi:hypothetical protein
MGGHAIDSESSSVEAGSNTSTVDLPLVVGDEKGSIESGTVKYGREFHGTRTRPLVRESAPHQQTLNCLTVIKSGRNPQMGALFQDRLAE